MKPNILFFVLKIVLFVTFVSCRRLPVEIETRTGDYVNYQIQTPLLDQGTYNLPTALWYNTQLPNLYWPLEPAPIPNNIPNQNIPQGIFPVYNALPNVPTLNVPFGNNQPPVYYPLYPPAVPDIPNGITPNGYNPNGITPNGYNPNGLFPPPIVPRPNLPPVIPPRRPTTELDDDESGRREPLQPNSDGVVDPEVGLKGSLVNLGPTMFGGTLDLDNMQLNGFSTWMKLMSTAKPWWKGSNVCIEREEKISSDDDEEPDDKINGRSDMFFKGSVNIQTCIEYGNKYECTTKQQKSGTTKVMTVTYHCCHGSQLHNRRQCVESTLHPLVETIKKINATEFLAVAGSVSEYVLQTENVTVFVPSNEAFAKFSELMLLTNQVQMYVNPARRRRASDGFSPSDLALNHIVKGFHDISPDEVFNSMYPNSTLQIRYKHNGRMVNCARIGNTVHATNGIVHTIDRVLMPVVRNMSGMLLADKEYTILNQLLKTTGLMNDFSDDEIWTFFAPVNDAFLRLNRHVFAKLMEGDGCAKNVLRHHMISSQLCSTEITDKMRTRNALGDYLQLSPAVDGESTKPNALKPAFMVENAKVVKPDVLATNGIIHAIDRIIFPESATPITNFLQKKNLTKFYSLIMKAGMFDEIQNYTNVTLFVPTDEAIMQLLDESGFVYGRDDLNLRIYIAHDEEEDGKLSDEGKMALRKFILHHITQGTTRSCGLQDNGYLNSLDDDTKLRTNLYSTIPIADIYNKATVDCAELVNFDNQQCDNIVHQIKRVLNPYQGTILDQINRTQGLSMLNKILSGTETETILKESKDITFLAPSNKAFESINKGDYEELLTNKKMVDIILKQHIFKGVSCCAGLSYNPWPFTAYIKAFNDVQLEVRNGQIGTAHIKACDQPATNGVMHITDKVMVPRKVSQANRKSNYDIVLYGLYD